MTQILELADNGFKLALGNEIYLVDKEETLRNISAKDGNINIYIGKESKVDDDVTIIKTKYKAGNEEGTIAIIGPKRMEYERVVNCLNFIKENIEGE